MSTQIPGHFGKSAIGRDLFSTPPAPPATSPRPAGALRRRLHNGHFAFMRAIVQGVELQTAWDRYLRWEEEGGDARAMRATIAWLRDEFAAAARREARFGTARLVLLDAARVPDGAPALPPLEQFVEQRGLEDFPQAEQIALYEAEYGRASQRQRRRARLIARQLEALGWIEQHAAQPPRADDSVAYWLNPLLAAPLQAGGLLTLGDLRADIDGRGPRWHRRLRGIGETKAARVAAWIDAHRATLGAAQPPTLQVMAPARSTSASPAPSAVSASANTNSSTFAPDRSASPNASPDATAPSPVAANSAGVASATPAAPALSAQGGVAHRGAHPAASALPRGALPVALVPPSAGVPAAPHPSGLPASPAQPSASPNRTVGVPPAGPQSLVLSGFSGPARTVAAAAPAQAAIVPLDRFACPPALDGRQGRNRRPPADMLVPIGDDRDAIAAWLAAPQAGSPTADGRSPHTRRAYEREAERLLLWCVVERGKALSSIDADDCLAYRAFLADPQPRARWCVRPSPGRHSVLWRPFSGPLGAAGQRQAVAALSSLFAFLVERRCLWTNPWRERRSAAAERRAHQPVPLAAAQAPGEVLHPDAVVMAARPMTPEDVAAGNPPMAGVREAPAAVARASATPLPVDLRRSAEPDAAPAPRPPRPVQASRPLDASRSLSPALWAAVLDAADTLPMMGAHARLRFALRWLYATGLRLSEAVGARLAHLRHEPAPDGQPGAWWLQVPAEAAGRQRELPLPDSLIDALRTYLSSRGLDPDPLAPAQREAFVLGQATERGERARRLPQAGPVDPLQGVRASTLAQQLKRHFGACAAARAAAGDAHGARQLAAASAHWLRHTHARHLLANGLPLALAQQHLGHAARSTTAAYLVSDRPPAREDWQAAWDATMAAQRGSAPYPGAEAERSTDDPPDR